MPRKIIRYIKVGIKLIFIFFLLLCCKLIINTFAFQRYHIPSASMSPAILPGDRIIVNKLLMGARIGVNGKLYRLPGLRKIKVGDIVVFNMPYNQEQQKISCHEKLLYCKRCIGMPGDTISIKNGYFYNTNTPESIGDTRSQRLLSRYTETYLPDSILNALPYADNHWTIKEMGPLHIPKAGQMWMPDSSAFTLYRPIIEYETGKNVDWNNGQIIVGNDTLRSYRFKGDYYFCCGDNLLHSYDSRYWGFVPEECIIGISRRILYSANTENSKKENRKQFLKRLD